MKRVDAAKKMDKYCEKNKEIEAELMYKNNNFDLNIFSPLF